MTYEFEWPGPTTKEEQKAENDKFLEDHKLIQVKNKDKTISLNPIDDIQSVEYNETDNSFILEISTDLLEKIQKEAELKNTDVDTIIADLIRRGMETEKKEPETAKVKSINKIDFPVDKINNNAWKLLEKDTGGQIAFDLANQEDKKNKINVPVFYSIDFDDINQELTITKKLTPYDKRVYITIAALFNAGNEIISLSQIYKNMGYKGHAGKNDLEKINKSIIKMMGAKIYLNNEEEIKKYNYSKFVYRGPLLPIETGELYNIQGSLTDAAIHIFREPPLVTFAAQRKQITKVSLIMLQSPISKTDSNLLIEDYLIERIQRNKGKTLTIKLDKFYEQARIETKKQRQRLPQKLSVLLDYYKEIDKIQSYKIGKTEIKITLP